MNKPSDIFLLVILCLILDPTIQSVEVCIGEECQFNAKGDPFSQATIKQAVNITDMEIKRVYWYYLRNSDRLYQANVLTPERYIHFFIYRNYIGTFLAIASWSHQSQTAELNTFVRLGNGYSEDVDLPYDPVNIDPYIISLKIRYGETLIELDENGNIICVDQQFCPETDKILNPEFIKKACQLMDEYIRTEYWYHIEEGSVIIHQETITTTQRVYAVTTYINALGTYLVISSCDLDHLIEINTFVRLGNGSQNPSEVKPIEIGEQVEIITAS